MSRPPELPGFDYLEPIGSGGYADVFLYRQHSPDRRVAIKVLDTSAVPAEAVADYAAEADLMAMVSAHPYIVQVFQALVAPDGRPCLVMEYYPGRNFYDRAKQERFGVAEALRVGIQLASAVETAHRAGLLHRDIKPANILTSAYRRPGLTDFGVAALQGPQTGAASGLSIPWSPPEALGESPTDRRADVYALSATIYTLLAGRAPFELRDGDNRPLAMIARIERDPVPSIGRHDVPVVVERVLASAMAKNPQHRPPTAAEFGRQLQAVESELGLAVTPLELPDDASSVRPRTEADEDDAATRVKGVREIRPHERDELIDGVPSGDAGTASGTPPAAWPRAGLLPEPPVADTVLRPTSATGPSVDDLPLPPRRTMPVGGLAAAAVAAVVLVVVGVALLGDRGDDAEDPDASRIAASQVNDAIDSPVAVAPPFVAEVVGVDNGDGSYSFSWEPPAEGLAYAVTPEGQSLQRVESPEFTSTAACVEVQTIAPSGLMSSATRGCAE